MSIFGAIAATVPVLGSLWDPELAQQRRFEQEEKQQLHAAAKAEASGDAAAAARYRGQARMTHNQRIRIAQDVERGKAVECRRLGWAQAADEHERAAQALEYEIWADASSAATVASQQPKTAATVPTGTRLSNATATPPAAPAALSSSALSYARPATEGTSWPPQQHVAETAPPVSPSFPPPPSYSDAISGSSSTSRQA